jgi:murein DD-endopeptidase MepM/ murein hydrolase activator NlpD
VRRYLGGSPVALLACVLALASSAPVAFADLGDEKEAIDARIDRLTERVEEAKRREQLLTTDVAAASERIDAISGEVERLSSVVAGLERDLAREQAKLADLRARYEDETRLLRLLEQNERVAEERVEQRLVELYQTDLPDELEIMLGSSSLDEAISGLEYLEDIARRDREIAATFERSRLDTEAARRRTARTRAAQAETTRIVAQRTAERREALEDLVGRRDQLVAAQADRVSLLANAHEARHEAEEDLEALEQASSELAERIRAAQGTATAAPGPVSASGFIWPVNGPLTSPFGERWGRLHAGIDIGAGFGTPILAAAAGTVIYAGWLGGYGNLVVIDHGGGLSTAYAHQQRIYVSGGSVEQGQTIGEVGSTGYSFGPHLHFEVRIGGSPVDPLGYL